MNFSQAVRRFESKVRENSRYGATDGETLAIFRGLIRRALAGENPDIPVTASGWGLYSGKEGAEAIAGLLYHEAWDAVALAKDASAITRFLKNPAGYGEIE